MSSTANPLAKHFRQPKIYIKLPSAGQWYPPGSIDLPVTREVAVYAMTARDELILKTPDALLNGQATVDVIQSCVPAIKNAWKMPSVDIDAVMIAIRQATYGTQMDFVSVCPHCKSKNDYAVDLSVLSNQIRCPDFGQVIEVEGLEIYIKPHTFEEYNKANLENYEQQRIIALVNNEDLDESVKLAKFKELFEKLLKLAVDQITKSVAGIKTEDGVLVEDRVLLDEFFKNCNKEIWDAVKTKLEGFVDQSAVKNIDVVCNQDACAKPYKAPLLFETSNFFG